MVTWYLRNILNSTKIASTSRS